MASPSHLWRGVGTAVAHSVKHYSCPSRAASRQVTGC